MSKMIFTKFNKIRLGYEFVAWSVAMNYFLKFTNSYLDLLVGSNIAPQQLLMQIGALNHYRLWLTTLFMLVAFFVAALELNDRMPAWVRTMIRIIIPIKIGFLFFLLNLPLDMGDCCALLSQIQ